MQQNKDYPTHIGSQHQILTLQKGQFFSKWVLEKQISVCKRRKCLPEVNSRWIKALDVKPEIETTRETLKELFQVTIVGSSFLNLLFIRIQYQRQSLYEQRKYIVLYKITALFHRNGIYISQNIEIIYTMEENMFQIFPLIIRVAIQSTKHLRKITVAK